MGIDQLLEHKVAVAVDVKVGQVDDRCITAVFCVLSGKVTALLKHHAPKTRRLDVLGTVLDVVAKEKQHRGLGGEEFLILR